MKPSKTPAASPGAERSAWILIERLGAKAFDFAALQVAILELANRSGGADHWRAIAREIERVREPSN